jgi:hypothetical protein
MPPVSHQRLSQQQTRYDPLVGVEVSWLIARAAADGAAREATVSTLLPRLSEHVRPDRGAAVRMIDVGAGSGANQRWLAPRLPFHQQWIHLDHDPGILGHTHDVGHTELVVGGIDTLDQLLDRRPAGDVHQPAVITCAAVLDVLTRRDLALLCELISTRAVPALLSLSVTGEMSIEPSDAADGTLLDAFNAHQRRDGRAGPDAPDLVVAHCHRTGVRVQEMSTPWVLDASSDHEFVARFLRERLDAAVEHEPTLGPAGASWLRHRLAQLDDPGTRITVGHRDLLLLP